LPVSRVDPVSVEICPGFVAFRLRQGSFCLGAPVRQPVGRGLLLALAPFRSLTRSTEVDEIAHVRFSGNRMSGWGYPGLCSLKELRRYGGAASAMADTKALSRA
jgi:hypothetical protein